MHFDRIARTVLIVTFSWILLAPPASRADVDATLGARIDAKLETVRECARSTLFSSQFGEQVVIWGVRRQTTIHLSQRRGEA